MSHKSKRRNQSLQQGGLSKPQILGTSFSGPIPPPSLLEKYNLIIPDGAERIMAMAESGQSHRQKLETTVINSNGRVQERAPIYGLIVALSAIACGAALIYSGRNTAGLVSIILALASPLGIFIYGKIEQRRELKEKESPFIRRQ